MPTPSTPVTKKKTAKKKTTKKVASKSPEIKKAKATDPVKPKASKKPGKPVVSPEQRYAMICEAAYYIAEQRGFHGGNDMDDWLLAELQVDTKLGLTR